MEGKASTSGDPSPDDAGRGPPSNAPAPEDSRGAILPGASLAPLSMLTADGEQDADAAGDDIGRIPHPQGRPVVVELPTDPAVLSPAALEALGRIAQDVTADQPEDRQKKAGHDGPAKSNREVKMMSAKHHRLREPR